MRISKLGYLWGGVVFLLAFVFGNSPTNALGLSLVALALSDFLHKLGRSFPLLELIFTIAVLQLILGAYFAYRLPATFVTYRMYIPEPEYMNVAVPAFVLFLLGMMVIKIPEDAPLLKKKINQFIEQNPRADLHLLLFGFVAILASPWVPPSFRFVFYLASNFIYIGVILYYFNYRQQHRLFVLLSVVIYSFVKSTEEGLFHDFFLWLILGSSLILIGVRIQNWFKFVLFIAGVFFIILLQNVKQEYRLQIKDSQTAVDRLYSLVTLANTSLTTSNSFSDQKNLAFLNSRLNQGWITSAVMYNVPAKVPFQNGQTIVESFQNALLPRFMYPDKKKAGGREGFRLYTGLYINDNTSMGIGLLGEAYINYGQSAGIYLFFWGVFLAGVTRIFYKLALTVNVLFFFMIPLIFLQVVKAETDMITVANHLVKSIIFVVLLYFFWLSLYKQSETTELVHGQGSN